MKSMPLLVFVFFATGCAPLSQAPLVYSSRNSIGVNISISNPETPGAELHIGYNGKDMAIVPVAVAKLPKHLGGDEGNTNIEFVKATYSGSVNPSAVDAAIKELDQAKFDLSGKTIAFQEAQAQSTANSTKNTEYVKLSQLEMTLDREIKAALKDTGENQEAQASLDSTRNKIKQLEQEENFSTPELRAETKTQLDSRLDSTRIAKETAENRVKVARNKLEEIEGKSDAYSVFGSFDSGTNVSGTDTKAGVTLGKMFSTGVAAQNVSQGIQQSGNYLARKACLDSLRAVSSTVTGDEAQSICGTK